MKKLLLFAIVGASVALAGNASADAFWFGGSGNRTVVREIDRGYGYGYPGRPVVVEQYRPRGFYPSRSVVASVQHRLKRYGYYRGPVDGLAGRGTSAAIYRFQRENGLRANGRITPALLSALRV